MTDDRFRNKTRDQIVLMLLRDVGSGSAFDLMAAYERAAVFADGEERHRFCQGVHGSLSKLFDEGRVNRLGLKVNPTTGAEVYVYAHLEQARAPRERVTKSWKDKYEALKAATDAEIRELREQVETLILMKERVEAERDRLIGA